MISLTVFDTIKNKIAELMVIYKIIATTLIIINSSSIFAHIQMNRDALQNVMDDYRFFSKIPGVVLSICQKEECFELKSGVSDPKNNQPMQTDALIRIGSLSKTMVATMIMQSIEEGLLNLDDELGSLLPEYEKWSSVQVKHLLRMESGIPAYLFKPSSATQILKEILSNQHKLYDPNDLLQDIKDQDLMHKPGARSQYNNSNYVILGLILERIHDKKLEDLLQERIAEPLRLTQTYLDMSDTRNPNMAKGFLQNHHIGIPYYLTWLLPSALKRADATLDMTYGLAPSKAWAAGGVVSTAHEMAIFIKNLFNAKLTSKESLKQMKSFVKGSVAGEESDYGFGLMRRKSPFGNIYGHGGVGVGYQNATYYIESEDISISLVFNSGPSSSYEFFDAVIDQIYTGSQYKEFPKASQLEEDHPYSSFRVQATGSLTQSSQNGSSESTGYAFDFKKFLFGQPYNEISISKFNHRGTDSIKVMATSFTIFDFFMGNVPKQIPFAMLIVNSRSFKDQSDSNGFISISEEEYQHPTAIAFTGYMMFDEFHNTVYCAKRVSDLSKEGHLQIMSSNINNIKIGDKVSIVGNLPLRNYRNEDRALIRTYKLETCPTFPL